MTVAWLTILYLVKDDATYWVLQRAEIPPVQVVSGNEFTIRGAFWKEQHLVIANTWLPEDPGRQVAAKEELRRLIDGKRLSLKFYDRKDMKGKGPWRVYVKASSLDVGQSLVTRGFLMKGNAVPLSVKPKEGTPEQITPTIVRKWTLPGVAYLMKLSPAKQIMVWTVLGILAASAFGSCLTGNFKTVLVLLIIGSLNAGVILQKGASWTPFLTPAVVLLLSGAFARAQRQRHRKEYEEVMGIR